MFGDGDCFFRAVLEVAGPHVRARLGLTESDGLGDVIKKMRAATATELTDHPERYAAHIGGVGAGTSVAALASDIRIRGNYANLAGDVTPWIASELLGLRLRIVTPTYEVSMGPENGVPVTLVQLTNGPLHFLAGVPQSPPAATVAVSSSLADVAFDILTGRNKGTVR